MSAIHIPQSQPLLLKVYPDSQTLQQLKSSSSHVSQLLAVHGGGDGDGDGAIDVIGIVSRIKIVHL